MMVKLGSLVGGALSRIGDRWIFDAETENGVKAITSRGRITREVSKAISVAAQHVVVTVADVDSYLMRSERAG